MPIGARFPSELAMAQQYGVSRSTVRSALSIVEDLGLVSRKRRAGTVVIAHQTEQRYTRTINSLDDLIEYAHQTERQVMNVVSVIADEQLAAVLDCKPGQKWLHVPMFRTEKNAERTPVCWTDAYIRSEIGEQVIDSIQDGSGLLCHVIEEVTGTSLWSLRQEVAAVLISDSIAQWLQVKSTEPGLQITKHYLDYARQVFLITVSVYPPDGYKFRSWLHRTIVNRSSEV